MSDTSDNNPAHLHMDDSELSNAVLLQRARIAKDRDRGDVRAYYEKLIRALAETNATLEYTRGLLLAANVRIQYLEREAGPEAGSAAVRFVREWQGIIE